MERCVENTVFVDKLESEVCDQSEVSAKLPTSPEFNMRPSFHSLGKSPLNTSPDSSGFQPFLKPAIRSPLCLPPPPIEAAKNLDVEIIEVKKRRGKPSKASAAKKARPAEDSEERGGKERWEDKHIEVLICIREELHSKFCEPPKQGVNLWQKLQTRCVAMCPDFKKDATACRNKWKAEFAEYKKIKSHNEISGNDRQVNKWYEVIDKFMATRANVCKDLHGGALDDEGLGLPQEEDEDIKELKFTRKPTKSDKSNKVLLEIAASKTEVINTYKSVEEEKLGAIKELTATLKELINKL